MREKSLKFLESKLDESINNLNCDLSDLISQLNNNISLNTANNFPSFQSKEEFDKNRTNVFNEFTEYNPIFMPSFIKDKKTKTQFFKYENLSFFMQNFYKNIVEQLKEKEKIVSRRISSCSSHSMYLVSFTNFIESNMQLIQKCQNFYFQLSYSSNLSQETFLSFIKLISLKNTLQFPLNYLYKLFKYYTVTKREEILTKAIDRFRSDLLFCSSISIPKTNENLEKELKRISLLCGIPFDLHSNDGQKFFYHCEKAFSDSFLLNIPIDFFDITKVEYSKENDPVSLINNSIINVTLIDKGLIKSLKSLFTGTFDEMTKFFNDELFKFNLQKEINRDHLLSFMKIRFVKNKKTLISLYNNCKTFISLKSKILNQKNSEDEVKLLFKQNLRLIFSFASKLINKTFGELDNHSIIETALSLQLRYEQSKGKVINALLTVFDHTNDESINSIIIELIDKKPLLFYDPLKSYEKQFELNVDVLDVIGQCLWLMVNLSILNEQFYSSSFQQKNKDVYLLSNDSVPISRFEVFPNVLSVIKFYTKAPLMAEEICESLSINYLRFNLYFSLSIWSCLLEEIKEFTNHCPLPYERNQIPYLSEDSYHLFSNEIFNNSEKIEKFFNELNDTEKVATFERNYVRLNKCLSKLQNFYNLQHFLIPIYNKQLNVHLTSPSFELPNLTPEFLLDSKFDAIIEKVYEEQHRFTTILLTAVRFNNYQSDSLYMRNNFDLKKLKRDLSTLSYEENIRNNLNEFVAFSMFYSLDDFNVDKPLCDLSTNPSYLTYLSLYELAFMGQLETAFFHYNPVREYFHFSENFFDYETNSISPFVIPTVSQCLTLPESKIEDAYSIISHRIRICHLVRFESVIQAPIAQTFNALSNGKLQWNGDLLAHLLSEIENHPFINKSGAYEAFDYVLFCRFNIAFLSTLFNAVQSADSDAEMVRNIKETWIEISQNRKLKSDIGDTLTIDRYRPKWVDIFLPNFFDKAKNLLIGQLSIVNTVLADNLISYPNLKSHEILHNELSKMVSVLACSILHSEEKLENCSIEEAVRKVTKADLNEHSHSKSSIPSLRSFSFKRVSDETIQNMIVEKQIKEVNEISELLTSKLSKNATTTLAKPEFYNDKKNLLKHEFYIPTPEDVSRQVNLEMNFRFFKLISKLREFLRTQNLTKEKLTDLCKTVNCYISIDDSLSFSIRYKNKKPIDARKQTDIQRFCQTYSGYLRNAANELKKSNEEAELLAQIERCFKNDQRSQWQTKCAAENSKRFMELNELREKVGERNNEQREEDDRIREGIRAEYQKLLDDIDELIVQERIKFSRYRDRLRNGVKESIQSCLPSDDEIDKAMRMQKQDQSQHRESHSQNADNEPNNESHSLIQGQNSGQDEFPKLAKNKSDSNLNNCDFDKLKKDKSDSQDEFPKLVKNKSDSNLNNCDFDKLVKDKSDSCLFPKFDVQKSDTNDSASDFPKLQANRKDGDDENELKFDHHVEFSPDSSRRLNRSEDFLSNDDEDGNLECRRSRPPSSTAGLLIAGESLPRVPQSPVTTNRQNNRQNGFPSPPNSACPRETTPLKRRSVHKAIFGSYMNPRRSEKVEDEIDQLKKEILRIRVVHAMNIFAMEKSFTAKITTATQEYREINSIFWNSKRNFDEFVMSMTRKIDGFYSELADYEAEIEATKAKIEKRKKQTLQLLHWKQVNLQMCDRIQSQLKEFNSGSSPDVDVLTLIKRIEESRAELERLTVETDAFEQELEREIREPMAAIDYYRRKIQQTKCETAKLRYRANQGRLGNEDDEEKVENDEDEENVDDKGETSKFKLKLNKTENEDEENVDDKGETSKFKLKLNKTENEDEEKGETSRFKLKLNKTENEDEEKGETSKFKLKLNKTENDDEEDIVDDKSENSRFKLKLNKTENDDEEKGETSKFKLEINKTENDDDDEVDSFNENSRFKLKVNKKNKDEEDIEKEMEELELEKLLENDDDYTNSYQNEDEDGDEDDNENEDDEESSNKKVDLKKFEINGNSMKISKNEEEANCEEPELDKVSKMRLLNQEIASSNAELRRRIKELEEMKEKWKPELRESIEQLTTEPQATPRSLINQASEKKIVRPAVQKRRNKRQTMKASLK
ncbi:hypothetical protein M9Y10_008185 [Tritrichomonas musculus]|uniref:Uncharacterized protein n=1 Tax=Tritrichomonas musculus TaxID=1915356 RepID=A0ABR2IZ83_9EUKA